jgi:uncharacterized protein (UPF0333 family)
MKNKEKVSKSGLLFFIVVVIVAAMVVAWVVFSMDNHNLPHNPLITHGSQLPKAGTGN